MKSQAKLKGNHDVAKSEAANTTAEAHPKKQQVKRRMVRRRNIGKLVQGDYVPFMHDDSGHRYRVVEIKSKERQYDVVPENLFPKAIEHPKEVSGIVKHIPFKGYPRMGISEVKDEPTVENIQKLKTLVRKWSNPRNQKEHGSAFAHSPACARELQSVLEEWRA